MRELVHYDAVCLALARCTKVDEVKGIHDKMSAIKAYARQADDVELYANAARVIWQARDRLGMLLRKTPLNGGARGVGTSAIPKENSTIPKLRELGVSLKLSSLAQQVADLPKQAKGTAISSLQPDREMRGLLSKLRRERRHKDIASKARIEAGPMGPFSLIYADPPWKFEVYSEKGLVKAPDQHYNTLTDRQLCDLTPNGAPLSKLAYRSAALLMWCTSSNIERAIVVMKAWGFDYKSQAVWVKLRADGKPWPGTGLVFRNMHEVLLYGTRGSMPGPQWQPPSVFMYPRGKHSEKPAEVRSAIERMYPDFDASTRIELFSRHGSVSGWTHWGMEA